MPEVKAVRREQIPISLVMETYRRAWETRDANLAADLFTEDATYQVDPFSAPLEGREAIRRYWEEATGPHRDVQFRWKLAAAQDGVHILEWQVEFTRTDAGRIELRGVMFIQLAGERIFRFREYWLRRQNSGPSES